jgi:hypothetical protein
MEKKANMYNRLFLLGQLAAAVIPPVRMGVWFTVGWLCFTLGLLLGLTATCHAQTPMVVTPDGKYLGNLSTNRYDPDSVANPYGQYGSRYSPDSVNNPYGQYGSRYSPDSARNPYALGQPRR